MSNFVQGEQTQSQIFQTSRNDRNKFGITCFVKNVKFISFFIISGS